MDETIKKAAQLSDHELEENIQALEALRQSELIADMWRGTACADLSDCIAELPADLGELVAAMVQQAADETEDRLTSLLWRWGAIRLCERLSEIFNESDAK